MKKQNYLCVGKIVGSRGLWGELKVEPWSDSPEDFCNIENFFIDISLPALDIESMRVHKSQVLIGIRGVNDKASAEKFRGKTLYAFKKDIPISEDRYFIEDLKGCAVYNFQTNKLYGVLKNIYNTGANDIYCICGADKKEYLVPIIDGTVKKIDLENEKVFINPVEGVFENE